MNNFAYASPTTLEQATDLLAPKWGETEILAGGTDLLSLMKDQVSTPARVVDIKQIPELNKIKRSGGGLSIGALVTLQDLLDNKGVNRSFPSLVQAAAGVASSQIRARGTVGGDLCQRPRCWYYRAGYGLVPRGDDGQLIVPRGDNRYHAIFSAGVAQFVCPSSLGPALVALGASVNLQGPDGSRTVKVADFFVAPQGNGERENVLASNELLTEITIPGSRGVKNATYEVRQKEALDWPLVTASVALKLKFRKVSSATIVLGHVAPTPHRAVAAEKALQGQTLNAATAEAAGQAATQGAKPLSGNEYKVRQVQSAVKRALLSVIEA